MFNLVSKIFGIFSKNTKIVVSTVSFIIAISIAALTLYLAIGTYTQTRKEITTQASIYANLIAQHDSFGFTLADIILKDMMDDLKSSDFNGPINNSRRRSEIYQGMLNHRSRMKGIASFTLIGADGIRRLGIVNNNGTDLSSREYFQANKNGKDFYISTFEDGLASGKAGIHVTRRFDQPDGSFGGVIEMNLAAQDVFFPFYKSINFGPNTTVTLREANRVIIKFPQAFDKKGVAKVFDPISRALAGGADHGNFITVDPTDHLKKAVAFERLPGSMIYATVALPSTGSMRIPEIALFASIIASLALLGGAYGIASSINKTFSLSQAHQDAVRDGEERQKLLKRLNSVVEEERKSISNEIHDVLNAVLIIIRLNSEAIHQEIKKLPASAETQKISMHATSITNQARDLYDDCRSLVRILRPEILDILGLAEAIREIVNNLNVSQEHCNFSFQTVGEIVALDSEVAIAAYRITQEALSNVVKHANANFVNVIIKFDQRSLRITVEDDGVGYIPNKEIQTFGVIGMRERVSAYNGRFEITKSTALGGTLVAAEFTL